MSTDKTENKSEERVAVATDKIPEGALRPNPDGTWNTYDADGNKTGTISEEEAEMAARDIDRVIAD